MNPLDVITRLIEASEITRRERALKKTEKWLAGKMRKAFQAQGKAFLAALPPPVVIEAAGDEANFPKSPTVWRQAWKEAEAATRALFAGPLEEGIRISLVAGADFALQGWAAESALEAGISFTLEHPRALEYARVHAAEQVTKISKATERYLNTIITNGIDEGLSYGQIAKQITDRYADFAVSWPQEHIQNRAHAIAVFETGDAYEEGNRLIVDELSAEGLEMEKAWLTVGDERVRESHEANEGEGWIPLDQSFGSGADRPPTDPGCRCSGLYQVKPA